MGEGLAPVLNRSYCCEDSFSRREEISAIVASEEETGESLESNEGSKGISSLSARPASVASISASLISTFSSSLAGMPFPTATVVVDTDFSLGFSRTRGPRIGSSAKILR